MESRSNSTSAKKRKKESHISSNQLAGNMLANEQIQEFICPVTTEIMFEPVMISGCGHLIEGKMASSLRKCPHCRGEEQNQGITVVAAPPALTTILSRTLAADLTLWQQVYLDHDYLAEILRKNELKTPTGERFIKLLENNTEENLNDKAPDGEQRGKSVIEILAGYYVGRELLRGNENIQRLISNETKSTKIYGITIAEWLLMEKEEKPEPKPTSSVSSARLFSSASVSSRPPSHHSVAHRAVALRAAHADLICQHVVYGNENGVIPMLRANSRLVEQKATVIDYSHRVVDDATPFQMALRAGDEVMAKRIKAIYLEANPENGQAVLHAQFNEVFPNGYMAHLKEQKRSADEFERDVLNPLLAVFYRASIVDVEAALDKQDNSSELCQKLNEFKDAFHTLSLREKVYNPNHLLKVFEKYNASYDKWEFTSNILNWLRLDLFWRQVIGWEERYMTANYAQSFCSGLGKVIDNHQLLRRTLTLHNYVTNLQIHFFPLDSDPSSKLGFDFGIYGRDGEAVCGRAMAVWCGWTRVGDAQQRMFTKFISSKNSSIGRIAQPESNHLASLRCLVQ